MMIVSWWMENYDFETQEKTIVCFADMFFPHTLPRWRSCRRTIQSDTIKVHHCLLGLSDQRRMDGLGYYCMVVSHLVVQSVASRHRWHRVESGKVHFWFPQAATSLPLEEMMMFGSSWTLPSQRLVEGSHYKVWFMRLPVGSVSLLQTNMFECAPSFSLPIPAKKFMGT